MRWTFCKPALLLAGALAEKTKSSPFQDDEYSRCRGMVVKQEDEERHGYKDEEHSKPETGREGS